MADRSGPTIDGLLETSVYARDLGRTAAFYRDLFGFRTLIDSPRLVAFDVAARSVLLVFQAGSTEDDVVEARGKIPGHDGRGRPHLALSIAWRTLMRGASGSPHAALRSSGSIAGRAGE